MEENIRIEGLSYGSAGVGHSKDGKTIFVHKSAPGDLLKVKITEDHPRFSWAVIESIIEPSDSRVEPLCPYYESCGGCSWQHIAYDQQLKAKQRNVGDMLKKNAHMEISRIQTLLKPTFPSKRNFGFRNKIELACAYTAKKGFEVGFYEQNSHNIVSIDFCPIAHKPIEKTPKALRGALRYLQSTQDLNIFRIAVRNSLRTGNTEIALWTKPGPFPRGAVSKTLKNACKTTSIVRVIAGPGKKRAIKQVEVLDGKGYWEEDLAGLRFKTSAPSFFQVNTGQAEKLIEEVQKQLFVKPNAIIADLYAGGGSFSLPLAQNFEEVIAVESAATSVRDLRRNADINQLDIDIIGGDSARELSSLGSLDALVVDPPRAGLAHGVIKDIARSRAQQVVYVSCNPATWARDVARFEECGYRLSSVQPVDLFPQSYHVEIVSVFERSLGF